MGVKTQPEPQEKPEDKEQKEQEQRRLSRTQSYWDLFDAICEGQEENVIYILENTADPVALLHKKDLQGLTPLKKAIALSLAEIARILVSYGAEPGFIDPMGRTPLHIAAIQGKRELIAPLLVSADSCVNSQDNAGWTPLHYAVRGKHMYAIKWLLYAGADVTLKNKDEQTPADLCEEESEIPGILNKEAIMLDDCPIELCSAFIGRKQLNNIGPDGNLMFVTSGLWSEDMQFILNVRRRPFYASPPVPLRGDEMYFSDLCHYRMMRKLDPTETRVKAYFLVFEMFNTSEVVLKVTSKTKYLGEVPMTFLSHSQGDFECYLVTAELDLKNEGQFVMIKRPRSKLMMKDEDGTFSHPEHPMIIINIPPLGTLPPPPPNWNDTRRNRAWNEKEELLKKLYPPDQGSSESVNKSESKQSLKKATFNKNQNRTTSNNNNNKNQHRAASKINNKNQNKALAALNRNTNADQETSEGQGGSSEDLAEGDEAEDGEEEDIPHKRPLAEMLTGDEEDDCEDFYYISDGWGTYLQIMKTMPQNILLDANNQEKSTVRANTCFFKIYHTSGTKCTKPCVVQLPKNEGFKRTGTVLVFVRTELGPDEDDFPDPDTQANEQFVSEDGKNTWGNFWLMKEKDRWNLVDVGICSKKTRVIFKTKKLGTFMVIQLNHGTEKYEAEADESSSEESGSSDEEEEEAAAGGGEGEGEAPEGEAAEAAAPEEEGEAAAEPEEAEAAPEGEGEGEPKAKKKKKKKKKVVVKEPSDEESDDSQEVKPEGEEGGEEGEEQGEEAGEDGKSAEGGHSEGTEAQAEATEGTASEATGHEPGQPAASPKPSSAEHSDGAQSEKKDETASNIYGQGDTNNSSNNNKNNYDVDDDNSSDETDTSDNADQDSYDEGNASGRRFRKNKNKNSGGKSNKNNNARQEKDKNSNSTRGARRTSSRPYFTANQGLRFSNTNNSSFATYNRNNSYPLNTDFAYLNNLLAPEERRVCEGLQPITSHFAIFFGDEPPPTPKGETPSETEEENEEEEAPVVEEPPPPPPEEEGEEEEVEPVEVESLENLPSVIRKGLSVTDHKGRTVLENFKYGKPLPQIAPPESEMAFLTTFIALSWRYRNHREAVIVVFTRARDGGFDMVIEVVKFMDLYVRAEHWWSLGYKLVAQSPTFPLRTGRLFSFAMEGGIIVISPQPGSGAYIITRHLYVYLSKINCLEYFVKRASPGKEDDENKAKKGTKKKEDTKVDTEPDFNLDVTGFPTGSRHNGVDIAWLTVALNGPDLWMERHVELRKPDDVLLSQLVRCLKRNKPFNKLWWKAIILFGYPEKNVEMEKGKSKNPDIIINLMQKWFQDNLNAEDRGILQVINVLNTMGLDRTIDKVINILKQYKAELLLQKDRPRYLKLLFHWVLRTKLTKNNLVRLIGTQILKPVSDIFLIRLSELLDPTQLYKIGSCVDVEDNVLHAISAEEFILDPEYLPFRVLIKSRQKKDEIIHYTLLLMEMAKQCEMDEAREFVINETKKWMVSVAKTEPEICAKLGNIFG